MIHDDAIRKSDDRRPCVYMLRCADGSLYTGWTYDIEKRLAAHSDGSGAKYTRSRLPVELVYLEHVQDKSSALKREAAVKKLTAHKKRLLLSSNENELI